MKTETIAYLYDLMKMEATVQRDGYERAKEKVCELRENGEGDEGELEASFEDMKIKAKGMKAAENALEDFTSTNWQPLT